MQIQFIAQGLPEGNSRPAGDAINEALDSRTTSLLPPLLPLPALTASTN